MKGKKAEGKSIMLKEKTLCQKQKEGEYQNKNSMFTSSSSPF